MTAFAELHDELRSVARDLLGAGPPSWSQLAAAGWPGLEVPESLGGAGATFAEVAVVAEELGRTATAAPFLGTVVLGVGALTLAAPGDRRDGVLAAVAAGDEVVAVAVADGADDRATAIQAFRIERAADDTVRLDGAASFVPDAGAATTLLVVADEPGAGPVVVAVRPGAEGLTVTPRPVLDGTRDLADVDAQGVAVEPADVLPFAGDPTVAVATLFQRAALAMAIDSVGIADAMLAATVEYAGVRRQFDRPIGSFQAVKHACADMFVQLSASRELVAAAVAQLAAGEPHAATAVSMAKAHATAMAVDVVGSALQLHGGIGYTWESGLHVHLKRATLNRSLFGSPRAHRAELARRYASPGSSPRVGVPAADRV